MDQSGFAFEEVAQSLLVLKGITPLLVVLKEQPVPSRSY
jgi:hypothetical protein